MSMTREVRADIRQAKKLRLKLPWWGNLCVIIGLLPIIWLFDHFGSLDLFLPTFNCAGVLGLMVAFKRELWPQAWFWMTMAVIAGLHALLILLIPWGSRWVPALAIAGIDSVDFCLVLWIIDGIGGLLGGRGSARR